MWIAEFHESSSFWVQLLLCLKMNHAIWRWDETIYGCHLMELFYLADLALVFDQAYIGCNWVRLHFQRMWLIMMVLVFILIGKLWRTLTCLQGDLWGIIWVDKCSNPSIPVSTYCSESWVGIWSGRPCLGTSNNRQLFCCMQRQCSVRVLMPSWQRKTSNSVAGNKSRR